MENKDAFTSEAMEISHQLHVVQATRNVAGSSVEITGADATQLICDRFGGRSCFSESPEDGARVGGAAKCSVHVPGRICSFHRVSQKRGEFYPGLYAVTPIQNFLRGHMMMIRKFPHRVSETMPRGAEVTAHD